MAKKPIHGDMIKKAIVSLDIIDSTLNKALIVYLERRGNILDNEHSYSLKEIRIELANIFGDVAACLIVKRISRAIDVLTSKTTS